MMKVVKKGIVLPFLLILASVAFILSAFFLFDNKPKTSSQNPTQTSSPLPIVDTSNWKTYTSTKYNFSFRYPTSIEFSNESSTDLKTLAQLSLNQSNPYVEIGITLSKENPSTLEARNRFNRREPNEIIKVGGIEAKKYFGQTGVAGTKYGEEVFLSHNDLSYHFILVTDNRTEILNQILSTFKFLNNSEEARFCGGIAGITCPSGYECLLDGNYPDAGGKCVKE